MAQAACELTDLCQRPTDSGLCTSGLGIRTSGLCLRTSDLRLLHIGLTSIPHRTYVYLTSDLRLSHIGLTPIPHRTYAYPTSDLRLPYIQTCVCTHQTCVHPHENVQIDTNEPVPTSLYQRACTNEPASVTYAPLHSIDNDTKASKPTTLCNCKLP